MTDEPLAAEAEAFLALGEAFDATMDVVAGEYGFVCRRCRRPVIPVPAPGSGWVHRSAADALACQP